MHWPSHCEAYYAEWIVRYHHPRRAPWKQVLRPWINNEYVHDGIHLSAATDHNQANQIPATAKYMRRCMNAFHRLRLQQNTDLLDHSVQAEPLWLNHRFYIPLTPERVTIWQKHYDVTHVLSLLHTRGRPLTDNEWDWYFINMAPAHLQNSPR